MPSIENIIGLVKGYLPDEDVTPLQEAYAYALKAHGDKTRASGESYISHPLAVAYTLAAMRLDLNTVVAGLLHSVLKEESTSAAELKKLFGPDVANLVKGATKITNVQFNSKLAYQAENVRKMLLAMAADIRVLLVKLADRLHDMQTLEFTKERQQEIAQETMDLYAPLAGRLGIDWMKRELEDLAFRFLNPEEYTELAAKIESSMSDRITYVEEVKKTLSENLRNNDLGHARILGRPKHLYSIYKKLIRQNITLEKVYDKVAFRIIVNNVRECYEALGIVHSLWLPIASRFKDFISSPKPNGYQSLHTSVIGPRGEFMEVQIRTEAMDEIAKEGIAAHWAYKEGGGVSRKDIQLFQWLKQLIQGLQELQDPKDFMDALKGELHQEEIYVLTPNGDVKGLKFGSTPLDFAYSIHTEVGHHCTGAKVNGRIVPLKYELKNGDVVEILTNPNQWPNRGWLSIVKTNRAKSRVRHWLKQDEQEKSLKVGREICERELKKYNLTLKKVIKTGHLREMLKSLSCNSLDDLLIRVGRGKVTIPQMTKAMLPSEMQEEEAKEDLVTATQERARETAKHFRKQKRDDAIQIDGINDVLVNISQCCMPVPGDEVIGFITAGRGISVHKATCRNLQNTDPQRWVEVRWAAASTTTHRAHIYIIAQDQKSLLANLTNMINIDDANILNFESRTTSDNLKSISVVLEVASLDHLEKLLQHIRQLEGILEARRK